MHDDLISLFDSEVSSKTNVPSLFSTSSAIGSTMGEYHTKSAQRDSFSDLTGLMRAKLPYKISLPSPRPQLALTTNGKSATIFQTGEHQN